MYYIKNGLGKNWQFLAVLFSAFGVLTVFGTGNATQVNTITTAVNSALLSCGLISEGAVKTSNLIQGIIIAALVALILLGGVKRIGQVTEKLVPFMALLYIVLSVGIILFRIQALPSVIQAILKVLLTCSCNRRSSGKSVYEYEKMAFPEVSSPMRQVLVPALSPMHVQIPENR